MRKIVLCIGLISMCCANLYAGEVKTDGILKSGLYKQLGFGTGYYRYQEFNTRQNDAFVMRMDHALFNVAANVGYISESGIKTDFYLDLNYAAGVYTGSVLDTSNADKDRKPVKMPMTNSFYHANLIVGYDLLKAIGESGARFYFQTGLNYYLSRTDFVPLERLQGYLAVPFELEGEIMLNSNLSLNFMAGVNWLLLAHHVSYSKKWHFSKDVNVIQNDGLGVKAFIGITMLQDSGLTRSVRFAYEHWSIGDSPAVQMNDYAGNEVALYEPKNATHIVMLQYLIQF